MKHILYLTTNEPICQVPEKLGNDFVIGNFVSDEESCKECSALLMAHNKKAYEDELLYGHNHQLYKENPLAPARGIMYGVLIGSCFWVLLITIVWAIMRG